jgi:RNA polymerase-interacting CarD/CdnL/TRCF family regulator
MASESKKVQKQVEKIFKDLNKQKGEDLDKEAITNLSKLIKDLMSNQTQPAINISRHSLFIMKGVRMLADRLIANPVKK